MTGPRFEARGKVAVVGYAHSPIVRRSELPLGALTIETCLRAIAHAGLTKDQIDGFTTGTLFPSSGGRALVDGVHIVSAAWLAEQLRIQPRWICGFEGIGQLPGAVIALSEGSIGWIPWFLERATQVLNTQKHWVAKGQQYQGSAEGAHAVIRGVDVHAIDVHEDYRRHFYGCFIDDVTGLRMLDVVGEDNVMIETDCPHSDTTWPHSIKLAHERLNGLPEDVQHKILRGNAERLYRFTPEPPTAKAG